MEISFTTSANYVNGLVVGNALGNASSAVPESVIQGFPAPEIAASIDPSSLTSSTQQVVSGLLPESGSTTDLQTVKSGLYSEQLVVNNALSSSGSPSNLLSTTYANFNKTAQVVSTLA